MKKLCLFVVFLIFPFLTACQSEYLWMHEEPDQISSIEIVDVFEDQIDTLLLIDSSLYEEFLAGLSSLTFHRVFGDPPDPSGVCVRIIYMDGSYEVFDDYGGYKVDATDESVTHSWLVCDENDYNDWIDLYYSGE